jgi:hypothetical protein
MKDDQREVCYTSETELCIEFNLINTTLAYADFYRLK